MSESMPVLDMSVLENLKMMVGEHYGRILEAQIGDAMQLAEKLRELENSQDMKAIKDVAHTVKGSFANIGAMRLVECARNLEFAARDGDAEAVDRYYSNIYSEMDQVRDIIQNLLNAES